MKGIRLARLFSLGLLLLASCSSGDGTHSAVDATTADRAAEASAEGASLDAIGAHQDATMEGRSGDEAGGDADAVVHLGVVLFEPTD
jgi:hypothetical protein